MELGPVFWLIMAVGVAVLIGVALAYGLLSPRLRRTAVPTLKGVEEEAGHAFGTRNGLNRDTTRSRD
jgi:hypothetical protein